MASISVAAFAALTPARAGPWGPAGGCALSLYSLCRGRTCSFQCLRPGGWRRTRRRLVPMQLPLVLMFVVLYFIAIRPQMKKQGGER